MSIIDDGECPDRTIAQSENTSLRTAPDRAGAIFIEAQHSVRFDLFRVGAVEHRERLTIEPGQTSKGCQPEISITRLNDIVHRTLRKTVIHVPLPGNIRGSTLRLSVSYRGESENEKDNEKRIDPEHILVVCDDRLLDIL